MFEASLDIVWFGIIKIQKIYSSVIISLKVSRLKRVFILFAWSGLVYHYRKDLQQVNYFFKNFNGWGRVVLSYCLLYLVWFGIVSLKNKIKRIYSSVIILWKVEGSCVITDGHCRPHCPLCHPIQSSRLRKRKKKTFGFFFK